MEVPSPTTTTGINSLHSRNSYSPKLLVARSLYLLTNHELGHVLQTSAVYILELPAYLNRHMMPNTPPPSPFLLHPHREDHMVVTPRVQEEPVPKKKTVVLLTRPILGSSTETVRYVTHTHNVYLYLNPLYCRAVADETSSGTL